MGEITKPILLDETGQAIRDALLGIKNAIEREDDEVYQSGYNEGKTDGLAEGEAVGYEKGHASGVEEGKAEEAAICAAKHFVHNFVGNGETSVSFYVPFEPDALFIIGLSPFINKGRGLAIGTFIGDLRAFGQIAGHMMFNSAAGAVQNGAFTTTSIFDRYSRTEDGIVTVGNLHASLALVFDTGYTYTAIAVKYAEQTDKERITAFVNGLTGSGTVTLNQEKVNAAFTDDEWSALIATKPDWTFTWI